MYCGGCFRDNALVGALRQLGHHTLMVPLYLPLTLDEADNSAGVPTFFGGINVYLEQKSAFFRNSPAWLHRVLNAPLLLKFASKLGARTRAEDVGELTLSMVRGEDGNQARELEDLIRWLKEHEKPEIICLSNALLLGMARRLKAELRVPVICLLSGEDTFLDALPTAQRQSVWDTLSERAREVELFIAPSRYFGDLMQRRLSFPPDRLRVIRNGMNFDGYLESTRPTAPPVLGYFARMCREKGLELMAEVYTLIRQRGRVPNLKLHIGGGMGSSDEPLVKEIRRRFEKLGISRDVEFFPNVDRAGKIEFFRRLTVFSTPALYGEAFGLYVIEAMAAGVPVVQPRHAAFPELVEETGGGIVCESEARALAEGIEGLILDQARTRALGEAGRKAVMERFTSEVMAREMAGMYSECLRSPAGYQAGRTDVQINTPNRSY